MPLRTHQVVIGLMAVIFVVICALVSTMHQQYRFLAAAGNNTADSPLAGNAGDGAEGMLDLNAPGIRPQLTLLLHNLTPGTPVPVAVVPPGASVAEARMITLAPVQSTLRAGLMARLATGGAMLILAGLMIRRYQRRYFSDPLSALVGSINSFSDDPRVTTPVPDIVAQSPEFIEASRALDSLQQNTLLALRQRERLADIGEAVAKINHDIRNALSSATLVADTLLASKDERVRRMAPHIVRSLEQSVDLCQSMLDYLAETPVPAPSRFAPAVLIGEIGESAGISVSYSGPELVYMDRGMLSRILLNLARNASLAGAKNLSVDIWRTGRLGVIDIADNGPGIPQEQWSSLFLAFRSKQRGGTGLGLAIARDLAVAQGGNLKLTRSTADGSEFRLQLPEQIFDTPASAS